MELGIAAARYEGCAPVDERELLHPAASAAREAAAQLLDKARRYAGAQRSAAFVLRHQQHSGAVDALHILLASRTNI